jgi:outer membrane receptor protein involved in Fe transport
MDQTLNVNVRTPDAIFTNIEQVEILKGPQGTLYGTGSATAGIVGITPSRKQVDSVTIGLFSGSSQVYSQRFGLQNNFARVNLSTAAAPNGLGGLEGPFDWRVLSFRYTDGTQGTPRHANADTLTFPGAQRPLMFLDRKGPVFFTGYAPQFPTNNVYFGSSSTFDASLFGLDSTAVSDLGTGVNFARFELRFGATPSTLSQPIRLGDTISKGFSQQSAQLVGRITAFDFR